MDSEPPVNKYRYTPFGSPRLKVESVYNPYEYTGRRLDEETGQYYYRARMYSTEQCRFTTQDPAGMQEGPNMYAYVSNNPVNHRDPSGLIAPDAVIDGGGGLANCPEANYDTIEECVDYHWYGMGEADAREFCHSICLNEKGTGGCTFTSYYWDCVESNSWDIVHGTSIVMSCASGCLMTGPAWPECVGACLIGAGVAASSPYVGCLVAAAYVC